MEAKLQEQIIGLHETFIAFEERDSSYPNDMFSWGGDWEPIVDHSLMYVVRTEGDSFSGWCAGTAAKVALRNTKNREEAQTIWTVALEQLETLLLGAWWKMSADASAENTARDLTACTQENQAAISANTLLSQVRSEWLDGKLNGKYSDVDLDKTRKISYNTIDKYRSGGVIRATTRRGLSDALNALGIACEYPEVPR